MHEDQQDRPKRKGVTLAEFVERETSRPGGLIKRIPGGFEFTPPRQPPPARQWTTVVNVHQQGRAARQSTNHRSAGSRRAGASSSSSSADPGGDGDSDPDPPSPRPRLAPPPRGILTFGCLTAEQRGAEVLDPWAIREAPFGLWRLRRALYRSQARRSGAGR